MNTVPDETIICKFRHLLERNNLATAFLTEINAELEIGGLLQHQSSVVDATLIAAPPSTKKRDRDPEMSSTRKGYHWYFGMKVHVGVDTDLAIVHCIVGTAAKFDDAKVMDELLLAGRA